MIKQLNIRLLTACWKSEQLQFGGSNGITRGWRQTQENYKRAYPDQATMGKLTCQVKDISRYSRKVLSLTCRFLTCGIIHFLK